MSVPRTSHVPAASCLSLVHSSSTNACPRKSSSLGEDPLDERMYSPRRLSSGPHTGGASHVNTGVQLASAKTSSENPSVVASESTSVLVQLLVMIAMGNSCSSYRTAQRGT